MDFLSRVQIDNNKWSLHTETFRWILFLGVDPEVDPFAFPCNFKIKKYYTRGCCSQAFGVDALTDRWSFNRAYAFPPFTVILRFQQRLRVEAVEMVVVAPYWMNRLWFPLLTQLSFRDPVPLPLRPRPSNPGGSPASLPSTAETDGLVLKRDRLEAPWLCIRSPLS